MKLSRLFKLHCFCFFLLLPITFLTVSTPVGAQRRERPGALKNTDEFLENAQKEVPVVCKYIKSGASFTSEVYYYSDSGTARMKIGTATLRLNGNHYTIDFKSSKAWMRDAKTRYDKPTFNPWRMENLVNNFTQKGKYETFKKNGKIYLRFYDGDTNNYITDILLNSTDQKNFDMQGEGLLFEFIYN